MRGLTLSKLQRFSNYTELGLFVSEQRLFYVAQVSGVPLRISEGIGKLCGLPGLHIVLRNSLAPEDGLERAVVGELKLLCEYTL